MTEDTVHAADTARAHSPKETLSGSRVSARRSILFDLR